LEACLEQIRSKGGVRNDKLSKIAFSERFRTTGRALIGRGKMREDTICWGASDELVGECGELSTRQSIASTAAMMACQRPQNRYDEAN
jgi:hypothetical protein